MSKHYKARTKISRRNFLKGVGGVAAGVAVSPNFYPIATIKRRMQASSELKILQWSHFVPRHDEWFDVFAAEWGEANGVQVTVDHVNLGEIPAATVAEINAGEGHDLIEFLTPPSSFEQSLIDLTDVNQEAVERFGEQIGLATRSTYNPSTDKFYGFCHGWVPDPGNYRRSLWEQVDMPDGPSTYMELLEGGSRIKEELGVQMGIGMSPELDSNLACRAIMWSFGASVQDENEQVAINSEAMLEAVNYMKELYEGAMTPEVFSWVPASNNQLLIAGQASYILNSISAYRTAQQVSPEVADDVYFLPPLKGPGGVGLVSEHVIPIYIMPNHVQNDDIAKQFMLHLVENYAEATLQTELYTFPSFADTAPDLGDWLDEDPYGSVPADKLAFLNTAPEWSTVIGHPGPANAAVGEVFGTFIIPNLFAAVARGDVTPEDGIADAETQINTIYDKWREEGMISS
jgi:multiple sugar transport system substrate-binding protein